MGFQALTLTALKKILIELEKGMQILKERPDPPSWGLDLLTILIAAKLFPNAVDYMFGGMMTPWLKNMSPEKTKAQRKKAEATEAMVEIAIKLGCVKK